MGSVQESAESRKKTQTKTELRLYKGCIFKSSYQILREEDLQGPLGNPLNSNQSIQYKRMLTLIIEETM